MVVGLRTQLDAGHITDPDQGSVRIGAEHDPAEVLCGLESALGTDCIGKLLARAEPVRPPTCPAGLTVFWALTALTISGMVMLSLASWSGLTQIRMAY